MKEFGSLLGPVVLLTALLGGCAGLAFNEADNGQTKDVFVGTTFSVSLPAPSQYREPELKGTIIRFQGRRADESTKGDIFEFKAEGLGEDEIRIRAASGKDYVLHLRIKSASDEPTVRMHQH